MSTGMACKIWGGGVEGFIVKAITKNILYVMNSSHLVCWFGVRTKSSIRRMEYVRATLFALTGVILQATQMTFPQKSIFHRALQWVYSELFKLCSNCHISLNWKCVHCILIGWLRWCWGFHRFTSTLSYCTSNPLRSILINKNMTADPPLDWYLLSSKDHAYASSPHEAAYYETGLYRRSMDWMQFSV